MKRNKLIHFPSLSVGQISDSTKNDIQVSGTTVKFYSKEFPEKWRYPYFLVTAGHNHKYPTYCEDRGLMKDALVFGDSGGFQIATGAVKWSLEFRTKIFNWLEKNSHIAMNLDIPPRGKNFGFDQALEISVDNFKWFLENQSGTTKFLNVLQGGNANEFQAWYKRVKDFPFYGWGIGGVMHNLYITLYSTALLLEAGEFDKENVHWLHYLGISKVSDYLVLGTIQWLLDNRYPGKIQVSTDSSTAGKHAIYGLYRFDMSWENMDFKNYHFARDYLHTFPQDEMVPCTIQCPMCKGQTFQQFTSERMTDKIIIHNTLVQLAALDRLERLINIGPEAVVQVLDPEWTMIYSSIIEMFNSTEPMKVFEKYQPVYLKYGHTDVQVAFNKNGKDFF